MSDLSLVSDCFPSRPQPRYLLLVCLASTIFSRRSGRDIMARTSWPKRLCRAHGCRRVVPAALVIRRLHHHAVEIYVLAELREWFLASSAALHFLFPTLWAARLHLLCTHLLCTPHVLRCLLHPACRSFRRAATGAPWQSLSRARQCLAHANISHNMWQFSAALRKAAGYSPRSADTAACRLSAAVAC